MLFSCFDLFLIYQSMKSQLLQYIYILQDFRVKKLDKHDYTSTVRVSNLFSLFIIYWEFVTTVLIPIPSVIISHNPILLSYFCQLLMRDGECLTTLSLLHVTCVNIWYCHLTTTRDMWPNIIMWHDHVTI